MKKSTQTIISLATALVLGAALTLAFAPFNIFPLGIIAPAGLFALLLNKSPARAFWLGFMFGLGLYSTGVYWVFISIHYFGDMPYALAGLITIGLIAVNALFPAATCYYTNRYFLATSAIQFNFAFAAIWVFSEWVRSWFFSGFTWMDIGYSQIDTPLKGYAPLMSVYSLSLAALVTSTLLVYAVQHYRQNHFRRMYYELLSIFLIWMTGALLALIPWTSPTQKTLKVSLVQGDIPQSVKWVPEYLTLSLDRYSSLSKPLWGKTDLIVWPEAAIPNTLQNSADFIDSLDSKARASNTPLLLGIPIQNENEDGYYNAIVALGTQYQVYIKRRLVPFGEYVPFKPFITKLFGPDSVLVPMSMVPGKRMQKPFYINGISILPSICYEITFPELIRTLDKNVGILLTVTNDAWFGKSSAQAQHLQMAQMRAIEMGRPVIFSSNNGITALINAKGIIETSAPQYQPYVITGIVQPMYGMTPWMKNGTDPILVILIALLITARRSSKKVAALKHKNDFVLETKI